MVDKMIDRLEQLIETGGDRQEIQYLARQLHGLMVSMPEVAIDTSIDIEGLLN